MKTNYSTFTSLSAYHEPGKDKQAEQILSLIKSGADNLLRLSELTGLPQATCSGRVNDLIREGKVSYHGFTHYRDRTRKKIAVVSVPNYVSQELF
jgi:hypothetical protein